MKEASLCCEWVRFLSGYAAKAELVTPRYIQNFFYTFHFKREINEQGLTYTLILGSFWEVTLVARRIALKGTLTGP